MISGFRHLARSSRSVLGPISSAPLHSTAPTFNAASAAAAPPLDVPVSLYTWGVGTEGQLAQPTISKEFTAGGNMYFELEPTLVQRFGVDMSGSAGGIVSCSLGATHSAFVDGKGGLWMCGASQYDKLGLDAGDLDAAHAAAAAAGADDGSVVLPHRVSALGGVHVVQASCGEYHTLALDRSGNVFSWGWGGSFFSGAGALGHGDTDDVPSPALVEGLEGTRITSVAAGGQHSVALGEDGTLYIWGCGEYGVMGDSGSADFLEPTPVEFFQEHSIKIASVDVGNAFTLALAEDGKVWTWGRNDQGQLGLGGGLSMDVYSMESLPNEVELPNSATDPVVSVHCGHSHAAAVTASGRLYVWGMKIWLQPQEILALSGAPATTETSGEGAVASPDGDSDAGGERIPETIAAPAVTVRSAALGMNYTLALSDRGELWSFGKGRTRCLGHGDIKTARADEPRCIKAKGTGYDSQYVFAVASGSRHVAALVGSPPAAESNRRKAAEDADRDTSMRD